MEIMRILLIEDDPVYALYLDNCLEVAKGTEFVISHGETLGEAKDYLQKDNFHAWCWTWDCRIVRE